MFGRVAAGLEAVAGRTRRNVARVGRRRGVNHMAGRDHYNRCYPALFAGAGRLNVFVVFVVASL